MNIEKQLDLSLSTEYDLIVEKDKTLDSQISCTYLSGTTYVEFDFSPYSAATLTIKNTAGTVLMTFSTSDSSIELLANGILRLKKSSSDMDIVRAGTYPYDMFITSSTYPKRGFLRGKITFRQNISN